MCKRYLTIVLLSAIVFHSSAKTKVEPYKDPARPISERVDDLLGRMTLAEKRAQLTMKGLSVLSLDENGKVPDSMLEKLFGGESVGCLESPFVQHEIIAAYSEAADRYLRTKTRLGIPAIQIAECLHGQLALGPTIFPQAVSQGSTWNPELVRQMASVIALEASQAGVDQALSPLFDLAIDPRYGRVEECYGEDPFLVKQMGVAYVIGMQGEAEQSRKSLAPGKLMCTAKHFVAYSVPLAGINIAPALVGERTLRELHFYPFEAVVRDANVYSLMPGYHELDGVPVHGSSWLLNDVLRGEWGFDGYVFSDYGAIGMMKYFHRTTSDNAATAKKAIESGVDLEAPWAETYGNIDSLVIKGKLDIKVVDRAVRRVLTAKFKAGLFDRPFTVSPNRASFLQTPQSVALARRIAEESVVLLENKNNILPLDVAKLSSIAVIGPNADKVQFGDYSITKNKDYGVTVLDGLRAALPAHVKINYAEGCGITNLSTDAIAQAVNVAKSSDFVILVVGGTSSTISGIGWGDQNSKEPNTCGEGFDRNELDLPGVQPQLVEAVAATGKPVILVLVNGRALTIGRECSLSAAVIEAWYSGQEGGHAIASVLIGDVNPSGKLPVTFPKTTGHIPISANYKPSAKGFYHQPGTPQKSGRDYVFSDPEPLYPFGYGLSYTTFEYDTASLSVQVGDSIRVSCTLRNNGNRDGAEVVQLYIRDCISSVTTPVKALKGFEKVFLKKGESRRVEIRVPMRDLALWNEQMQRVVEPGRFDVFVGSSSKDIRLKGGFDIVTPKKYCTENKKVAFN